jgi:hypothetical protein
VRGLCGGKWRHWLAAVISGDGCPLGSFLLQELNRQFERLELLTSQIKELKAERAAAIRF